MDRYNILKYWSLYTSPFKNLPDPHFFYCSQNCRNALNQIIYTIRNRLGCAMLTGDPGVGKTTISNLIIKKLPESSFKIALFSNPLLNSMELLHLILAELNIDRIPNTKSEIYTILLNQLKEYKKHQRIIILIFDEAQLLSEKLMEEIELLIDLRKKHRFLITLLLVGQTKLKESIENNKLLKQRIDIECSLEPFDFSDTNKYLLFRQKKAGSEKNVFAMDAVNSIYDYSNGIPRAINHVCDLSLFIGKDRQVDSINSQLINEIINDRLIPSKQIIA